MAKTALLIGTSHYQSGLKPLPAAAKDVAAMQAVLEDDNIGQFAVQTLIDPTHHEAVTTLDTWFRGLKPDDLALLYVSGHGVKDDRRDLYFAIQDTQKNGESLISPTAISARFIKDHLIYSKARRQVVILDCCFSGAFGDFLTKDDDDVDLEEQLAVEGRVVLASSSSLQYSFEQTGQDEKHQLSVYTRFLVEGLRTGIADSDEKGWITVGELHRFTSRKVQEVSPAMTPKIIVLKDEGFLIPIAKAPLGDPKLRYRRAVQELVQENVEELDLTSVAAESAPLIDPDLDRACLDERSRQLKLTLEEIAEIELEVTQPFEDLREKVKTYRTVFERVVQRQYPLGELQQRKLKRLQNELKLRDEDVQKIEAQVIATVQPVATAKPPASVPPPVRSEVPPPVRSEVPPPVRFEVPQPKPKSTAPKPSEEDDLSSEKGIDYARLRDLLKAGEWKEADNETYEVMIRAVGKKSGDWFTSEELLNFPCADLKTIDRLWVKYSKGQFGFSVQKEIYVQCGAKLDGKYPGDKIWDKFCDRTGWRVNGKYIYYSDVIFGTSAPQGHLPALDGEINLILSSVFVVVVGLFSRIQTCKL